MTKVMEAVRATLWTVLGGAADRIDVERGDLLALLLEYGMLGGFSEAESDRFVARMDQIEAGLDDHLQSQPAPEPQEGPVLPPLPGPPDAQVASGSPRQAADRSRASGGVEKGARQSAELISDTIPRGSGFVLLVFETGDRPELSYVSNCNRADSRSSRIT